MKKKLMILVLMIGLSFSILSEGVLAFTSNEKNKLLEKEIDILSEEGQYSIASLEELKQALNDIGGNLGIKATITVTENITLDESVLLPVGSDVYIQGQNKDITIKRTNASARIDSSDAILHLSNITLDGGAVWENLEASDWYNTNTGLVSNVSLIRIENNKNEVNKSALYLNENTTIKNCEYYKENDNAYGGAIAILAENFYIEMNGALIKDNVCNTKENGGTTKATRGAGIYIQSDGKNDASGEKFEIIGEFNSGKITHNAVLPTSSRVNNQGGNMYIMGNVKTTLREGFKISEGYAERGGGLKVFYGAKAIIDGATITHNEATLGGGIHIETSSDTSSKVEMLSGMISDNYLSATIPTNKYGAGVSLMGSSGGVNNDYQSLFEMTGGTIKNNVEAYMGGGIFNWDSHVIIAGDAIIENNSAVGGGGVVNFHRGVYGKAMTKVLENAVIRDNEATLGSAVLVQDHDYYLDSRSTTIEGTTYLYPNKYIKLVGADENSSTMMIDTQNTDSNANRIVVAPASITYKDKTYTLTNVEDYVNHFIHTSKRVMKGSVYYNENKDSENIDDHSGNLVLGKEMSYLVEFDSMGGSYIASQGNLSIGDNVIEPTKPTREGYVFDGWYTGKLENNEVTYQDKWNFNENKVNGNMTLYAKWKRTFEVSYIFESVTEGKELPVNIQILLPVDKGSYEEGKIVYPSKLKTIAVKTSDGVWQFKGWDEDSKEVVEGITFKGTWEFIPNISVANQAPTISAEDKTLTVGDIFDPLTGVTANDKEDGNVTKKIEVLKNTVDTTKAGVYEVAYKVTDSKGASTTKTIQVTVKEKTVTKPIEPSDSQQDSNTQKDVETSDNSNVNSYITLLFLSLGMFAFLAIRKRYLK